MDEPDHGHRYELAAVVTAEQALVPLAGHHPALAVVPLPASGLALVPAIAELVSGVTPALVGTWPELDTVARDPDMPERWLTGPESGFTLLTPGLLALVRALSMISTVAFLEADYRGRDGWQAAAAWRGGSTVLGPLILGRSELFVPRQAPISQVLRLLGVRGDLHRDEFVVAGLGLRRRTEDWA